MKVTATVDGRLVELELTQQGDHWLFEGRKISVIEVEAGIYSILLESRSYQARVEAEPAGVAVTMAGQRFAVELADPRRMNRRTGRLHREGRQAISAFMPGKVVRLLVCEGESVAVGQGLLVIEAMKMQNEMKAPKPGRVVSIPVREGATVAAGEVLAIIE